ncbi:MAG: tetratricopeptide repeat protein [Candidatus Eiseniibacteriota bacterium]
MTRASLPPWLARTLAAWAVALVLGACAYQLAATLARRLPRPHPLEELSYYPSGRRLGLATLGHAESFADLAWMRAVQYYGEHRRTDMRFERLFHVFDILTTLSPRFVPAYVFGGFALAQEGSDFERAEALMLKGLEANPTSGLLAFELGFLYYVKPGGRDLSRAGEYFEQAARLPGGPPSAARFAAYVRQNAGDFAVARALWLEVARSSHNRYLREMAEREIHKIDRAWATGRAEEARRRLSTPTVVIRRIP